MARRRPRKTTELPKLVTQSDDVELSLIGPNFSLGLRTPQRTLDWLVSANRGPRGEDVRRIPCCGQLMVLVVATGWLTSAATSLQAQDIAPAEARAIAKDAYI